ncbi:MAG: pseudouridine synthase [Saprospiraceae bacterium]
MSEIAVIYEDNHLLAVNKPAGWLVQGDRTAAVFPRDGQAVYREKIEKPGAVFCTQPCIDRPVSGAVLFARTDKALSRLTAAFRDQKCKKHAALVIQAPGQPTGVLPATLKKTKIEPRQSLRAPPARRQRKAACLQ